MRKYIILLSIMLVSMTGMGATAPLSPVFIKEPPVSSDYIVMERPDDRPIIGIEAIGNDGTIIVGTDEALYLYKNYCYVKTLPHMVWEMFRAGEYVYAVVNPYNRKAMYANRVLYRTRDGKNWQRISNRRGTSSTLFAVDTEHDVLYGANSIGYYHSSLYKKHLATGVVTPLGDKKLRRISAIGWFQGALYVTCDHDKLYVSYDNGSSFENITDTLNGGRRGAVRILTSEHYLRICVARHWLYRFDGKRWDEIASKTVKHGVISLYQIHQIQGHQLVFDRGVSKHFIMDLRTLQARRIHLPEVYQYPVYTLAGEDLLVSAMLPEDHIVKTLSGSEESHEKQEKATQLLKVRLTGVPVCNKVLGQHPVISSHYAVRGMVIDSGRIIINNGKELVNAVTGRIVHNNRFHIASRFKRGAVKGNWFIRMIPRSNPNPKAHHYLRESSDRGKTWGKTGNITQEGAGAVIDDSLRLAYFRGKNNLWRISIKPGDHHNYSQQVFKGTLESLVVDKTSRVWVQGSEGIFVSQAGGWWQCPLPFRDNKKIPIRGFALPDGLMAVTYRDQLYFSRNDTVKWKRYPVIDPCSQQPLPVRIIGYAQEHIILKDRIYGHLWIVNLKNGTLRHCQLAKTNGVAVKATLVRDILIVQTSGTPLQSASGDWKRRLPPKLILFHLKS